MTNDWSESMNWEFYGILHPKVFRKSKSPPRLLPQLVILLEVGGFPPAGFPHSHVVQKIPIVITPHTRWAPKIAKLVYKWFNYGLW